jgi:hypothetical protein
MSDTQIGFKAPDKKTDITYIFKDKILDTYEEMIIKNADKVAQYIGNYISRVTSILSTRGPSQRLPFYVSDKEGLFKIIDIPEKELLDAARESKFLNIAKKTGKEYEIVGNPFYLLCVVIIAVYKKNEKLFVYKNKKAYPHYKLVTLFLTLSIYSWIYVRQFKFDPDESVMEYTMENLSKKFIIKRMNNMFELNQYWAETNLVNMEKLLDRQGDVDLVYFVTNLFSRISQSIVNISREFYKNHEEQKRSSTQTLTGTDDEGKEYLQDVRSISNDIEVSSRKIQISFISDTVIDLRLLELACAKRQVSKSKISVILTKIRESDDEIIKDLIVQIISYYLEQSDSSIKTIKSQKFITMMLKVYSISNTTNPFVLNIKKALDELLKKYSEEYLKTSREATLSNMRSVVYTYFVLYISRNIE